MTEHALTGFVKIVELGSFTAAAQALFISQSALSQQIRTLENHLQFALFRHGARQVVLTPAGQAFYPRAKQILRLYQDAVKEGMAMEKGVRPPHRHLKLACHNTALAMFCYDLFALTPALCLQFSPLVHPCASRAEAWRALETGDADLAFQMESDGLAARGLHFMPVLPLPELCIPFNVPESLPGPSLTLEQAFACRWIFAFAGEPSLYEAQLAREAYARSAMQLLEPGGIASAAYGLPTLMFTPLLYHRRPDLGFVRVLHWGEGGRFGIVTAAGADDTVREYAAQAALAIQARQLQLFGL